MSDDLKYEYRVTHYEAEYGDRVIFVDEDHEPDEWQANDIYFNRTCEDGVIEVTMMRRKVGQWEVVQKWREDELTLF